jgi:hypothetical protein
MTADTVPAGGPMDTMMTDTTSAMTDTTSR